MSSARARLRPLGALRKFGGRMLLVVAIVAVFTIVGYFLMARVEDIIARSRWEKDHPNMDPRWGPNRRG